jgi:regulatory protein
VVVRFTPKDGAETAPEVGDGRIAPVTYLPGARPTLQAQTALAKVHELDERERRALHRDGERARGATPSTDSGDAPGGQAKRASNVAIHQLARRGMSRWELAQVLHKRGVDETAARAELDRLESVGLLDDAALALSVVFTQHTRKGLGRAAIAHELRRRHIDQQLIDDALSELDDDDELERALELAMKRVGQLSAVDDETARRRLSGFLARKGYGSDVVRQSVERAMSARGGGPRFA